MNRLTKREAEVLSAIRNAEEAADTTYIVNAVGLTRQRVHVLLQQLRNKDFITHSNRTYKCSVTPGVADAAIQLAQSDPYTKGRTARKPGKKQLQILYAIADAGARGLDLEEILDAVFDEGRLKKWRPQLRKQVGYTLPALEDRGFIQKKSVNRYTVTKYGSAFLKTDTAKTHRSTQ